MNWFERYGIPGLYFVGIMVGWVYALNPGSIRGLFSDSLGILAFLVAISLPIGYVVSIWGQLVYLSWRRCLWWCPRLRRCGGVHGAAMDRAGVVWRESSPLDNRDEAVNEARTLLLTSLAGDIPISATIHMREWIARRMDVIAINQSILWATVIAPVTLATGACFSSRVTLWSLWVWSERGVWIGACLIIGAIVAVVMLVSAHVLRGQVVEAIAGVYRVQRRAGWVREVGPRIRTTC